MAQSSDEAAVRSVRRPVGREEMRTVAGNEDKCGTLPRLTEWIVSNASSIRTSGCRRRWWRWSRSRRPSTRDSGCSSSWVLGPVSAGGTDRADPASVWTSGTARSKLSSRRWSGVVAGSSGRRRRPPSGDEIRLPPFTLSRGSTGLAEPAGRQSLCLRARRNRSASPSKRWMLCTAEIGASHFGSFAHCKFGRGPQRSVPCSREVQGLQRAEAASTANLQMAYDVELADRIRTVVRAEPGLTEKRMFGGLAFLIQGNMAVSASSQGGLLLRVDPAKAESLVSEPQVRRFEMRAQKMDGWLRIDADAVESYDDLQRRVSHGVTYARSLRPK